MVNLLRCENGSLPLSLPTNSESLILVIPDIENREFILVLRMDARLCQLLQGQATQLRA
jgi:hypothetical protein